MNQDPDLTVLDLYERIQALPEPERDGWLVQQHLPEAVIGRVRRLLRAANELGGFLDAPETSTRIMAAVDCSLVFPTAGDRLGNYELLRPLAAGGMGVVYLGRRADDVYHQNVAIKLIRAVHLRDSGARAALVARFETERQILAQLNHPNIARILDGGSTGAGVPWLVMEYVDGEPLDDWCDAQRLDVRARVRLLCKVCDGVQEAHRHLIVHRDIKPDNILVTAAGEPRLIDFGIARELVEEGESGPQATLYSAMTPAYASPEQIRRQPLTTSSDVYSLGIVLYQLLAGRRPYSLSGLSPAELEHTVCEGELQPMRQALLDAPLEAGEHPRRLAQLDDDLERIVGKALHKDPARRYGSAEALADDLRRYLAGRPVLAHPDSAWYRTRKFVRRHRLGVGLMTAAVLAIMLVAALAFDQAAKARLAASDTDRANRFLVDVLTLSDPYQSGRELSMDEAMERAWGLIDERFADRPKLAADLRLTLAEALMQRGRLDAAAPRIEQAAALAESSFGSGSRRAVAVLWALAALRKQQGRSADAERVYLDALDRLERADWRDEALHSGLVADLGVLNLDKGQYEKARGYLERSFELDARAPAPNPINRAVNRANMAVAMRGLGDYEQADALYAQAEDFFRTSDPDGSLQWAILLNNRAMLARIRGHPEQAVGLMQRSLDMKHRLFTGDHVQVLLSTINLARACVDTGQAERALPHAEAAAAMAARLYPDAHDHRIQAITVLAAVERSLGRFGAAEASLQQAEALLPQSGATSLTREFVRDERAALCEAAPASMGCN